MQNNKALLNAVTKTLNKTQEGRIHDKVEGGLFRYSTKRDWSMPHYEKICEDNAKLLTNYLQTFQVTGENAFKATAQEILNYIDNNLFDKANGGSYSSQDADEEYYKLGYGERERRTKPTVDKTLFTDYNAIMIPSYLLASIVLENPAYEKLAIKTMNVLLEKGFEPKEGMCHYILNNKRHHSTFLKDQTCMMRALIDAYQWAQDRKFLRSAESIAGLMLQNLWNDDYGFLDRPMSTEDLGMLKTPYSPFDENAVAADAFLRLNYLTGDKKYLDQALATLQKLFNVYRNLGVQASSYALAVELVWRPIQVQIVGKIEDDSTQRFVQEALRVYNALRTIEVVDPTTDIERFKALKYPVGEKTVAYICARGKCTLAENVVNLVRLIA